MPDQLFEFEPATRVLTRTLVAAGFEITGANRQPRQIEVECERADALGSTVRYLISLSADETPPMDDVEHIREAARENGRVVVLIARSAGEGWISWSGFLEALGGAVPTWRALGPTYEELLQTTSFNRLPAEVETGEAWLLFELAIADGMEFLLGRRVRRMGGAKRGQRVSDMMTQTPDERVLVIDAKASGSAHSVTMAGLRPLIEYVKNQKRRQQGNNTVGAAVLVAREFEQEPDRITETAAEFLAETGVPLACLQVEVLAGMIRLLAQEPHLRNAIRWARVFCQPRIVPVEALTKEIEAARSERVPRTAVDTNPSISSSRIIKKRD
jgi:hypothetical protein